LQAQRLSKRRKRQEERRKDGGDGPWTSKKMEKKIMN